MANGRKLNEVTNVSTLASSDRLVTVRTSDGKTVQISLTDFMNTLIGGLGTAATHDVTTSATDTTSGRLLKVGDFGWGTVNHSTDRYTGDLNDLIINGTYGCNTSQVINTPPGITSGDAGILVFGEYHNKVQIFNDQVNRIYWRMHQQSVLDNTSDWSPWQEILHTGNLDSLLGTAATRDVTTSATDTTEGRLLKVGDFGLGHGNIVDGYDYTSFPPGISEGVSVFYDRGGINKPTSRDGHVLNFFQTFPTGGYGAQFKIGNGENIAFSMFDKDERKPWREFHHTGNTTVDGNGFIKKASPIVKLFNDHIEHEGFNQETPTMTKLDTGVYEIKGTSGLAKRGWYIETPTDRNNDAYFNTEWEQLPYEIPVDESGQTPEPQDVTLLIKTFERVWDAGAGRFTNGAPIDIDVAAGSDRFIALRFTEVKPVEEEPEGEEGE